MRVIPAERGRVSIQLQFSSGGPAFHPAQQAEGGAEQPGGGGDGDDSAHRALCKHDVGVFTKIYF